jgi:hypothetical protein
MNRFTVKGKMQHAPQGASVLSPLNAGTRLIVNFVSLGPKFDQPLDKLIERIWNKARQDYFGWSGDIRNFKLGNIKDTLVNSDIMILSLLVRDEKGVVDGEALEKALDKLTAFAKMEKGSIHISQFLIDEVPALKELVDKHCASNGVNCYFYDLPVKK